MNKGFATYLCPICMVKFPYPEKLSQHWNFFHRHEKTKRSNLRGRQPFLFVTTTGKRNYHHDVLVFRSSSTVQSVSYSQPPSLTFHVYKTKRINERIPEVCYHCGYIIWDCAKTCLNCEYICHVECERLILTHCNTMARETKSVGEYTSRGFSNIGEIRGCQSLSSPSPILMSSRSGAMSPSSDLTELDLTYITDRLIVMSFPASGLESVYHTSLLKVLKMLQTKHGNKFKIINVSERRYDMLQLNEPGQVLDYGWPDHLAPPLDRLDKVIRSIHSWFQSDAKNVVVIHCKGGRSRLGVVIATYIQFSKNSPSPQVALDWFALRRYYDSRLEGAIHPSQNRYVDYFGKIYEKRLSISKKCVYFQNIIMHGVPHYGNGTGLQFCLKIYQGYQLKHTTKTYIVTSTTERAYITIEDGVLLHGDIMVKCLQRDALQQNVIFRLQFHTDALEECVAVFGKYDLDEAFRDSRFPDSCYMEFVFAPGSETQRRHDQGIFDMERQMAGVVEADRVRTTHVPGPIDGNLYAKVDPSLKEKLRSRQMVSKIDYDAAKGIEELDDLLGEINILSKKRGDLNGNIDEPNRHKKLQPKLSITKIAPKFVEEKVNVEQRGVLHQAPTIQFSTPIYTPQRAQPISPPVDDVFHRQESLPTAESSIKDLLYELNHSPLNTSSSNKYKFRNMSAYDNDSTTESEADTTDGFERHESVEGIMEISPGTVAQHVRNLNKVLFNNETTTDYNRKYGVPLAGMNSPDFVEEKITQFNSRSVAPGFCSSPIPNVYHSQGAMTAINYDMKHQHQRNDAKHAPDSCKQNGHVWFDSDSTDLASDDASSSPSHHDEQNFTKRSNVLSRSDSAYGDSMRSSTSSPIQPAQHEASLAHISTVNVDVGVNVTHKHDENVMDSYSPRSDGNNGKSSGIGSITSSMTSLDEETLNRHGHHTLEMDQKHHQKLQQHAANQQTEQAKERNETVENVHIQSEHCVDSTLSYSLQGHRHAAHTLLKTVHSSPEELSVEENLSAKVSTKPHLRSLTVVEEHIPSAVIQKEVEFLNENIFKSLLEEDLKATTETTSSTSPITKPTMPIVTQKFNDRLTTSSNEYEVKISEEYVVERKQSLPTRQTSFSSSVPESPASYRRFPISSSAEPSPKLAPKLSNLHQITPTSNGVFDGLVFQRQNSQGSTNSDASSPISPNTSRYPTLRGRRRGNSGSSNSSVSSTELFHEFTRYPSVKFDKDTMSLWYKPNISRDEATRLLRDRDAGAFVVRDSQSYDGAFGLAVKVETPPLGVLQQVGGDLSKVDLDNELVRHFLIEPCKKGVRLKGSNNEPTFPSLVALVYQHTLTKMALPVTLVIPELESANGPGKSQLTEVQLLEKGAACNLAFLGAVLVESLTGDGAVHYAMNKVTTQNASLKSTIVNIKVNQHGITLTDNQRRIFFRKHYPIQSVIHCGVDPKGRKINLKPIIESVDREVGCFGFVVKKEDNSQQHVCLILAEIDSDQPASAVINFIHKVMRFAKV